MSMEQFEKYSEYLSKSRLKTWVTCPRKFYFKYVMELETETTESMIRGTAVHELIEAYYENAEEYAKENDEPPKTLFSLLASDERDDWREYLDPYLAHFLGFERRRWENADSMEDWLPIAIEEEMWEQVFDDTPVLMGYADAMLPAASFSDEEVPLNTGCVLIDFKTGTPNKRYMGHEDGGVYLDLAYYSILFESEFDIVAVGAYYPKTDTLVTSPVSEERQRFVEQISREITNADEDSVEDYSLNEAPLCAWGEDEDERCEFYEECPSTWAVPVDKQEETIQLIRDGLSDEEIATELGTTKDALQYWIRKKRWHRYRD